MNIFYFSTTKIKETISVTYFNKLKFYELPPVISRSSSHVKRGLLTCQLRIARLQFRSKLYFKGSRLAFLFLKNSQLCQGQVVESYLLILAFFGAK